MKKEAAFSAALATLVLSMVLLASCTQVQPEPRPPSLPQILPQQQQPGVPQEPSQQSQQQEVRVEAKPYRYVTEKPTGWFRTGQDADVVLYATGFGESGGPLVLNHPGKVATDGKRLVVSDTWNNRVLVWKEIPTKSNQPPDLVLGQEDFYSNTPGLGAGKMNWPMGVATDGEKLIVGDANNDRVLIWNDFPTGNGEPADLVLGAPDFDTWPDYPDRTQERDPKTRIYWPWDVWTDGKKLIVGSTGGGGALVWNAFPTRNNQQADLLIGAKDFPARFNDTGGKYPIEWIGGPRGIASDGRRLVISTYQPQQAYVWNEFPAKSGQPADFILQPKRQADEPPDGVMGAGLEGGKLVLASSHHVFFWNTFPTVNDQKPDMKLGVQRTRDESLIRPYDYVWYNDTFAFPYDAELVGNRLIVADTNNNRVLIFNEIPKLPDAKADVILGKPEIFLSRKSYGSGPLPFSDGKRLIVGVDGIGVWIYDKIPDESHAEADVVVGKLLGSTTVGGYAFTAGEKLVMVHREGSSVFIWNQMPEEDDKLPDVILGEKAVLNDWGRPGTGRIAMNGPNFAASDGKRLFVSDQGNNRILVWNAIPTENQTPADMVLGQPDFDSTESGNTLARIERPSQISTDGKRLVAIDGNNRVLVWKTIPAKNGQPADFEIKIINRSVEPDFSGIPVYARFSLPGGVYVYGDKLFVADNGNNRVLVWSKFPESEADEPDIVLGQKDFQSNYPSATKNGLFMPSYVSFDGSFLWVGEMKWSNRLLRFSVQPD